jgi:hypothetical protein
MIAEQEVAEAMRRLKENVCGSSLDWAYVECDLGPHEGPDLRADVETVLKYLESIGVK